MADVSWPGGDGRRGQLILLTGIVLAAVLVGLALLVNSTIFTANQATRGQGGAAQGPGQVAGEVAESVGDGVDGVNDRYAGESYATLYGTRLAAVVGKLESASAQAGAVSGSTVSVTTVPRGTGGYAGTRIADEDGGSFRDRQGATDWTVADGHLRAFRLRVDRGALTDGTTGDTFAVEVTAPDTVYELEFYRDGDDVVVAVTDASTGATGTCRLTGAAATVDVTAAQLGSQRCAALSPVTDATGVYEVAFENADSVTGTYALTVDRATDPLRERTNRLNGRRFCATSDDTAPAGSFFDHGAGHPYAAPAIYSASVDIEYAGDNAYETRRQVTPGLAGDATTTPKVAALSVDNTPGPATEFEVAWTARDPDSKLSAVALVATDTSTGNSVTKDRTNIGTNEAADTVTIDVGDGGEVSLTLFVEDDDGNTRAVTQKHIADDDDTGCTAEPP